MKTYIRKIGVYIMVIMLVLSGCGSNGQRVSENQNKGESATIGDLNDRNNTDVVLVMDESGTMIKADPNRFAIEGAKLFIDMGKHSGINLGLVEFSNQIKSTGLIHMKQKQNKEYLKGVLDSIQYSGRAHTDTGAALLEAVSVLEESDSSNDKAIILFTDGKTDIDVGTPGRTTADSIRDTDTAVEISAKNGYTIYCIGLNYNGNVDEEELAKMTSATNGKYHIATNVDELREFFNSIFNEIDETKEEVIDEYIADGDYHESVFTIDNVNVAEANILILSSKQVEDIILTNNEGNIVDLEKDKNIVFSSTDTYSLVKLITPEVGEWRVRVKGVTGDQIKIGMTYNFTINLMVEVENTSVVKGRMVDVRAYLVSEGEIFKDKKFYENMSGYITAINKNTGEVIQEELGISGDGISLKGYFIPHELGEYGVTVHVEGNKLLRDSDTFTITVTKNPVFLSKDIESWKVKEGKTKEIDLDEYFSDEDGDEIIYSVKTSDKYIETNLDDSILSFTGIKGGEEAITISADNGAAVVKEYTVIVKCTTIMETLGKIMVPIFGVGILALLILLKKWSKTKLEGVFKIHLISGERDQNGVIQTQRFDILNPIQVSSIAKREFTADKLIKTIQGYYTAMEFNQNRKEAFLQCSNEMLAEAKKVTISGSQNSFELKIKNSSDKVQFYNFGTLSDKKMIIISIGDSKYGVSGLMEKEFGMHFTHHEDSYTEIHILYKKM